VQDAAPAVAPKKGSIWDKKKTTGWNCPSCFVECKDSVAKCPACGTANPAGGAAAAAKGDEAKEEKKPAFSFGTKKAGGKGAAGKFAPKAAAKGGASKFATKAAFGSKKK
jgi:hypothetical protein